MTNIEAIGMLLYIGSLFCDHEDKEEINEALALAIVALKKSQGEWIDVPVEPDLLYNTGVKFTCSVCGRGNCYGRPPFCMYCGAKMERGGEKNEQG